MTEPKNDLTYFGLVLLFPFCTQERKFDCLNDNHAFKAPNCKDLLEKSKSILAAEQNPLFHFRTEDGLFFVDKVDLRVPVEVVHLLLTLLLVVGPVAVLLLVVLQLHLGVEESLASAAPARQQLVSLKDKEYHNK